jgi:hypothetical protein
VIEGVTIRLNLTTQNSVAVYDSRSALQPVVQYLSSAVLATQGEIGHVFDRSCHFSWLEFPACAGIDIDLSGLEREMAVILKLHLNHP